MHVSWYFLPLWFCLLLGRLFVGVVQSFQSVGKHNQPPEPKQFCSSNIQVGKKLGSCIRSEGCQHRLPRFPCWVCAMWFLQCIRFGEASHPGPPTSVEWTVGTFNPNGLAHRADVVSSIQGDFWGVTETHLSRIYRVSEVR